MNTSDNWEELVANCRVVIEDFNDFSEDSAIVWAANRIEELEAKLRFLIDNDSINDSSIEQEVAALLDA